jgi:hypothetical protein
MLPEPPGRRKKNSVDEVAMGFQSVEEALTCYGYDRQSAPKVMPALQKALVNLAYSRKWPRGGVVAMR